MPCIQRAQPCLQRAQACIQRATVCSLAVDRQVLDSISYYLTDSFCFIEFFSWFSRSCVILLQFHELPSCWYRVHSVSNGVYQKRFMLFRSQESVCILHVLAENCHFSGIRFCDSCLWSRIMAIGHWQNRPCIISHSNAAADWSMFFTTVS